MYNVKPLVKSVIETMPAKKQIQFQQNRCLKHVTINTVEIKIFCQAPSGSKLFERLSAVKTINEYSASVKSYQYLNYDILENR